MRALDHSGGPATRAAEENERGVGLLGRIFQFLIWLLLLSWVIWLVRRIFAAPKDSRNQQSQVPSGREPRRLFRDPVCGTHVSPEISYSLEESGQVIHFCSVACRERYQASQRHAAGGSA